MVVPELAKRGAKVSGYVRGLDEIKTAKKVTGVAEVVVGDLADEASVRTAMKDVDRVFYIAPAFLPHEAEVGVRVVEAAKNAGIGRFVFSSVIHPILSALGNHAHKGPVEEPVRHCGITVNVVTPGPTVTAPVKKNLPPELLEAQKMGRAIARDEVPEDLVGITFFLASPDVDFISGQIINVDGGKNMH
jgi:NAD(P)-dependent dehydrogenase (short-subunit alcohol dehydrogenase family)